MILKIKNKEIIIDDEDYEKIKDKTLYLYINGHGHYNTLVYTGEQKTKALGCFLFGLRNCEHINGNKLDFRRCNVQERTRYFNGVVGRSGEKNIEFRKNKYFVFKYIDAVDYVRKTKSGRPSLGIKKSNRQRVYVGMRETLEEAIRLRDGKF